MSELMDAATLGEAITAGTFGVGRGADIFRTELLPAYEVPTDGSDFQRWLDGATEPNPDIIRRGIDRFAARADAGITSRRVRILSAELTPYERYSCEFGYAHLYPAEDIRVLRRGEHDVPSVLGVDYWLLNGRRVLRMHYGEHGSFLGAEDAPDLLRQVRREADRLWEAAEPFGTWWARHTELRRRLVV